MPETSEPRRPLPSPPSGALRYPNANPTGPLDPSSAFRRLPPAVLRDSILQSGPSRSAPFPRVHHNRDGVSRMTVLYHQISRLRAALDMPPFLPQSALGTPAFCLFFEAYELDGLSSGESEWVKIPENEALVRQGLQMDEEAARWITLAFMEFCTEIATRSDDRAERAASPSPDSIKRTSLQRARGDNYDELITWFPYPGLRDRLIRTHDHAATPQLIDHIMFVLMQYQVLHSAEPRDPNQWEITEQFMRWYPELIDAETLLIANTWRGSRGEALITDEMLQTWTNDPEARLNMRAPTPPASRSPASHTHSPPGEEVGMQREHLREWPPSSVSPLGLPVPSASTGTSAMDTTSTSMEVRVNEEPSK